MYKKALSLCQHVKKKMKLLEFTQEDGLIAQAAMAGLMTEDDESFASLLVMEDRSLRR